ncbi:MAG: hypothetical protein QM778_09295 [Myxococcales bacterium]
MTNEPGNARIAAATDAELEDARSEPGGADLIGDTAVRGAGNPDLHGRSFAGAVGLTRLEPEHDAGVLDYFDRAVALRAGIDVEAGELSVLLLLYGGVGQRSARVFICGAIFQLGVRSLGTSSLGSCKRA